MAIIYNVDTTKEVTPLIVRDAIVTCFFEAHCAQSGLEGSDASATNSYCKQIVQKAFLETKGDFDNPTKQEIVATIPWLAEFSESFRDQSVIQKHMKEIQKLIELIKE